MDVIIRSSLSQTLEVEVESGCSAAICHDSSKSMSPIKNETVPFGVLDAEVTAAVNVTACPTSEWI
jgi:hypothetical protein